MIKSDIRELSNEHLIQGLKELGEKSFRAKQIFKWLWQKGAKNFDEMTDLSISLRTKLHDTYSILPIVENFRQTSSDGTIKIRFQLHDGHFIESVLIPVTYDNRYTVCVSSQVGCSLTCSFCATGKMKLTRNLSYGEIFDQVFMMNAICEQIYDSRITNVVYMGMGEPLLAYRPVIESIYRITDSEGFGMSHKRITVSTVGIAKMIRKLADDKVKFNLAISLHAADDAKRNQIMPINESNNLDSVISSLQYFHKETGNRISFEYIALKNFNDGLEDAKKLAKLCSHFPVRVNVIEYNPIGDGLFERSDEFSIDNFALYLRNKGIMITVRKSRGRDIDAACGQLANK